MPGFRRPSNDKVIRGMPSKLYKAHSYVNNFQGLGDVCLEWVYHLRKAPVAPYEDLIRGYGDLIRVTILLTARFSS